VTKRIVIEATSERDILSWMIASDEVYRHIVSKYDSPRLFESQFSRTVAAWIHEWAKLEPAKAPGESMTQIYAVHQTEVADETTSRAVAEFLSNLSRDWKSAEPLSAPFAKDQADLYFRRRTVSRALEMAQRALEANTPDGLAQAENAFLSFSRATGADVPMVDLLRDAATIQEAYTTEDEVLFRMPGCLDQLLGPIIRGDFVGILAPQKRGKSFWVDLFSMSAMFQGCKVLILDFELVKLQKARRLWGHLQGRPRTEKQVSIPYFSNTGEILFNEKLLPGIRTGLAEIEEFQKGVRRTSQGGSVRFLNFPTFGTTMRDIKARIRALRVIEGWEPDLIVFDSLDYVEPENKRQESRDQLHEVWGHARGLAQELNCAVLSPSHTGRQTSKGEGTDSDVSGDIRKLWKVTKSILLNQTTMEKQWGIMRVSSGTNRDEATTDDQVVVLQHLGINRPYLDSRWLSQVKSDLVYRPKGKSDLLD
jgi:replicative DNA helicase